MDLGIIKKFKIIMVNMPRALMEKLDNIQEEMGKVNIEIEKQKEMQEIKTLQQK